MQIGELLDRKGHQIYSARPDWTMRQAAALIAGRNIGTTIVTDEAGTLLGILSERDFVRGIAEHGSALLDWRVASLMTTSVVTCTPETSVGDALSLMASHRIRHLPVMREADVIGLISIRDVLEFRLASLEANFASLLRGKRDAALARQATERAEHDKAGFVAGLGNKLVPSLHAILDIAEDLSRELSGLPGRDCLPDLREIAANGRVALEAVEHAVALTQLQSRELTPAADRVMVPELIAAAAATVRETAGGKGVSVVVETSPTLPPISADRRMVKQMLHELLDNAVKFTPAGGTVTIGCSAERDDGIRVTVADAGVGMTAEQIARVAQPFYSTGGLTSRGDGGIGLALVDAMMRAHQGALSIESRVGIGTTATLHFPPAPPTAGHAEAAD